MHLRYAGILAFVLSGCASGGQVAAPIDPAVAERARAAGLLADEARADADRDAAALAFRAPRMAYPILVPSDLGDFRLDGATVDDDDDEVYYRLRYRRPDGACFAVSGSGGEGRPISGLAATHDTASVVVGAIHAPVVIYRARGDQPESSRWEAGDLTTGSIEADGLSVRLTSLADGDDDCRAVSLDDARMLVAGLRPLDPDDDLDGAYRSLDIEAEGQSQGTDSEMLARSAFAPTGSVGSVTVETVRRTEHRAVVLVTRRGVGEPPVRDEQTRAVYVRGDEEQWRLVSAGQRVRCEPGHGHQDWSAETCG